MSSFKTIITLKQITPYIHFQYNQSGATIRATEVKPKLDRFLLGKIKAEKSWFIGETESLNYKMKFEACGDKQVSKSAEYMLKSFAPGNDKRECQNKSKAEIHQFYFGNQGTKDEQIKTYKETVFYKDGITMEIFCVIPELLAAIKENIVAFFVLNNFGTRQDKGFGGFVVNKIDGQQSNSNYWEIISSFGKPFFYCKTNADQNKMMNYAHAVYTIMKGGSNSARYDTFTHSYRFPNSYIKGYIQRQYFTDNGLGNTGSDKAKIKKDVITPQKGATDRFGPAGSPPHYSDYLFVRALLGLADHYEFRDDIRGIKDIRNGKTSIKPQTCRILSFDGLNMTDPITPKMIGSNGIERFASPITIKIFNDGFYFIFDEEKIKMILGRVFILINDFDYKKYEKETNRAAAADILNKYGSRIQVPKAFDVEKFIKDFIIYFDAEKKKIPTRDGQRSNFFNLDKDTANIKLITEVK